MISTTLMLVLACTREESVPGPSPEKKRAVVEQAFRGAKSITLYSVAGDVYDHFGYGRAERSTPKDAAFALDEGDGVFGAVEIADAATIAKIGEAFLDGYLEEGPMALCYIPHHVLRVRGVASELQIHLCFTCHYATIVTGTASRYDVYQDASALEPLLDDLLGRAGIPVKQTWKPFSLAADDREYVRQELGSDLVTALESATALELYSLDPEAGWDRPIAATETADTLAARLEKREGVLGSTTVLRDAVRKELLSRTFAAIRKDANAAKCFRPRHALRFTQATRTIVIVVCFECDDLLVMGDGRSSLIPLKDVAGLEARLNSILEARKIAIADGSR